MYDGVMGHAEVPYLAAHKPGVPWACRPLPGSGAARSAVEARCTLNGTADASYGFGIR